MRSTVFHEYCNNYCTWKLAQIAKFEICILITNLIIIDKISDNWYQLNMIADRKATRPVAFFEKEQNDKLLSKKGISPFRRKFTPFRHLDV
jgi:hypothetical protein